MASNKSWDLFFSYNWGKNNINIEKVNQIHNRLKKELNLEIWWDQTHLNQGNWVEKVTNGAIYKLHYTRLFGKQILHERTRDGR